MKEFFCVTAMLFLFGAIACAINVQDLFKYVDGQDEQQVWRDALHEIVGPKKFLEEKTTLGVRIKWSKKATTTSSYESVNFNNELKEAILFEKMFANFQKACVYVSLYNLDKTDILEAFVDEFYA